jgi:hypothetical protein
MEAMSLWVNLVAATALATVVVVSLFVGLERRAWRLRASWRCPRCGSAFGKQKEEESWAARTDPNAAGVPTNGPVLRCAACARAFRFANDGTLVDERVP